MKKQERVLVIFNTAGPTTLDQDYTEELKSNKDWMTEKNVIRALQNLEHDHALLGIYDDIEIISEKIKQYQPTVIFNLVERFNHNTSHDRDIAALLKLYHIPVTGCGATGLTLCKSKSLSKKILSFHKIRVPEFATLPRNKKIRRHARLKFPVFIKPLREEASLGIAQASFVEDDKQFNERVKFIHDNLNQDVIAEEYIDGRELYVSLMGNKRLEIFPTREMSFLKVPEDEPKIATYKAKWDTAYRRRWGIQNQFARSIPENVEQKIIKTCKKIYHLLSIRGYARLDLRLTPAGDVVFIEANPNPMLAKDEDFAESAAKAGIDYPALIQKIIHLSRPGTK